MLKADGFPTPLSNYGSASTRPSPVTRMMTAFAGGFRDGVDINLGVGYVNEKTIPVALLGRPCRAVAADAGDVPAGVQLRQPGTARPTSSPPSAASSPAGGSAAWMRPRSPPAADHRRVRRHQHPGGPRRCPAAGHRGHLRSDVLHLLPTPWSARASKCWPCRRTPRASSWPRWIASCARWASGASQIAFFYVVTVNNPSCTILSNARRRALYDVAARTLAPAGPANSDLLRSGLRAAAPRPRGRAVDSVLPRTILESLTRSARSRRSWPRRCASATCWVPTGR